MSVREIQTRTIRGIQQSLLDPPRQFQGAGPEAKGVVYTKPWVADLVLDLAGYCPEGNLVDATDVEPAAGEGAFLRPMIMRLIQSCRRLERPLTDCVNSLIAFELDEESALSARRLTVEMLTQHHVDQSVAVHLASRWIRSHDYLFDTSGINADFVAGNPPYVRLEDIPEETIRCYRQAYATMCGRADLYVAFFEAALRQLKPNGVCAFLCADRWIRNQYGAELRELVTSEYGSTL